MPQHDFEPEPPDCYAHIQWQDIAAMIGEVWSDADQTNKLIG
jgi:hypothetical protein